MKREHQNTNKKKVKTSTVKLLSKRRSKISSKNPIKLKNTSAKAVHSIDIYQKTQVSQIFYDGTKNSDR